MEPDGVGHPIPNPLRHALTPGVGLRWLRAPGASGGVPATAAVRQPDLGNPPAPASLAGFGSGASIGLLEAGRGSEADLSQGTIEIRCGSNPAASGTFTLTFPIAPAGGQYVMFADWTTFAPVASVNNLLCGWTSNRPLRPFETLYAVYQWAISQ